MYIALGMPIALCPLPVKIENRAPAVNAGVRSTHFVCCHRQRGKREMKKMQLNSDKKRDMT